MSNSGTPKVLAVLGILFAGFALLAWALYVYVIPYSMSVVVSNFPKTWEAELGKKFKESFLMNEEVDDERTQLVNKFYSYLKIESGYNIHITVVDSKIKNAFALPGGEIVVYSALLKDMKTYKELVALLGHETGHVYYRHSLKSMADNLANYLIISAIFGDFTGVAAILVDNANNLRQLSYSRSLETESDMYAYEIMKNNQVDPQGMIDLFENLQKQDGLEAEIGNEIPQFLQTHPKVESRIEEIKNKIEKEEKLVFPPNDSLALCFLKMRY